MFESAMFLELMAEVQKRCHDNSAAHGFWEGPQNIAEKLALIHSEVSEALEAHRKPHEEYEINETYWVASNGSVSEHRTATYSKPEGFGIEMADAVIRIMDLCEHLGIDLGQAILDKMAYNAGRPKKHGKMY